MLPPSVVTLFKVIGPPEVRVMTGLGPVELRLTGRFHDQGATDFYRTSLDVRVTWSPTV